MSGRPATSHGDHIKKIVVHPSHTHRCVAVIKSISSWSEPLIHLSILVIAVLVVMTASIPKTPPHLVHVRMHRKEAVHEAEVSEE